MTREALANDRGLQPERTALAWTRTSLAVVVSGALLLFKDREIGHLGEHPVQLVVGVAASAVALVVFALGVRRRKTIQGRPRTFRTSGRPEVMVAGASIILLTALVVAYLLLPVL
jgi:uncharacterized membrane protein YidH (DUF202 family)